MAMLITSCPREAARTAEAGRSTDFLRAALLLVVPPFRSDADEAMLRPLRLLIADRGRVLTLRTTAATAALRR